jgi:hypothetical protein
MKKLILLIPAVLILTSCTTVVDPDPTVTREIETTTTTIGY